MEYIIVIIAVVVVYQIIKSQIRTKKIENHLNLMIQLYGDNFGTMIANNKIAIGMSKEMLERSWGQPPKVDGKVVKENYEKINYYYSKYPGKAGYKHKINLVNGIITEIRED